MEPRHPQRNWESYLLLVFAVDVAGCWVGGPASMDLLWVSEIRQGEESMRNLHEENARGGEIYHNPFPCQSTVRVSFDSREGKETKACNRGEDGGIR